jgi:glycosyltransferase involved in cell wall biosynthesis
MKFSSGYSTVGSFPFQMDAISGCSIKPGSSLWNASSRPPSLMPIVGCNLSVHPLNEPAGESWRYLLSLLAWLLSSLGKFWHEIKQADVLHIAVPGLGSVAILLGLLQRKRMFIRHCGTWNQPVTRANHALLWLLEKIADSDRNIVMATGGGEHPPSNKNPHVSWIFSTTLFEEELKDITPIKPWRPGDTLKLITVGRITELKNAAAIVETLPEIMQSYPKIHLRIVGDGPYEDILKKSVQEKDLGAVVEFTGNLDHQGVLDVLRDSHLFVFPTRVKEGFPKAVLEALACGLPVIATCISVIPSLLKNGAGILLDETTSQSIATAVKRSSIIRICFQT